MPNFDWEYTLNSRGFSLIAGIDEVGRGPLAGPVAAGAVILKPPEGHVSSWLEKIDDSKKLTPSRREQAATEIKQYVNQLQQQSKLEASEQDNPYAIADMEDFEANFEPRSYNPDGSPDPYSAYRRVRPKNK